jgi:hypothetical protein
MGREPREETIPECNTVEAMVFKEFFIAGLRMPPHPVLADILLKFQVQIHQLTRNVSYPTLQAKPSTHRMCAQDHLFHTHGHKVFIDSQMSRIKYIYYINNISKD